MNLTYEVKFFTQKATVSHEASGPRHSRLTDSSSQTKSEKETVQYTVQMTSCPEHTDSTFRGRCCFAV